MLYFYLIADVLQQNTLFLIQRGGGTGPMKPGNWPNILGAVPNPADNFV